MKTNFKLSGQRGFSLVELLVVIAVIAIIAAIAIPNISNITQQARIAKDQRNAQNIASVAAAAKAAGVTNDLSTASAAISALESGVDTTLNGQVVSFSITDLATEDETGASNYLEQASTNTSPVTYNPAGS